VAEKDDRAEEFRIEEKKNGGQSGCCLYLSLNEATTQADQYQTRREGPNQTEQKLRGGKEDI